MLAICRINLLVKSASASCKNARTLDSGAAERLPRGHQRGGAPHTRLAQAQDDQKLGIRPGRLGIEGEILSSTHTWRMSIQILNLSKN